MSTPDISRNVALKMWQQLLVGVLLLFVLPSSRADWWMDQPYENRDYNSREVYNGNVTLECQDDIVPESNDVQYWIRPDLAVMEAGDFDSFWTLDGYAGWQVSPDGRELYVTLLQESQFGFYHCVVTVGADVHVIKKAINYRGPYFGDLWPKYRMNTIIGCSAAGGVLVICLFFMLIQAFRYVEPEEGEAGVQGTSVKNEYDLGEKGMYVISGDMERADDQAPSTSSSSSSDTAIQEAILKKEMASEGYEAMLRHRPPHAYENPAAHEYEAITAF